MLDAGRFGVWLAGMRAAVLDAADSDVPCDGCTACCTSSQFVHIAPDETDTLAHIPPALCVPAPGMPEGHVVLGYDERGHCPMLGDGVCSIYAHRPRTCRIYDCRIFAATGITFDDPNHAAIADRVAQWRFDLSAREDRAAFDALRAVARSLGDAGSPIERAVRAVEECDGGG